MIAHSLCAYAAIRPAVFLLPPEKAHRAAIRALQMGLGPHSSFSDPRLTTQVNGLSFPNPLGLAAGFDKNAEVYGAALRAGFGFTEVGTLTPRPQAGNPSPRLFRLVEQEAIINRLGFNNEGVEAAAARLRQHPAQGIVGGNIGKNKDSEDAIADYVTAFHALYPLVAYITVNISSPNTPGLRALQAADELHALVAALDACRATYAQRKPIWVKIAPDNDADALAAIADVAMHAPIDALIASNTTLDRTGVAHAPHGNEAGGLSGRPLFAKSTETLATLYRLTEGKVPLVGVGGIASAQDAYSKIRAGASLLQLYTALVYQGFGLVEHINRGLADLLARDGFTQIRDAVGADAR